MNPEQVSMARNPLMPAALAAIKRAAQRARREALATHTAILITRQGRIVRLEESDIREQEDSKERAIGRSEGQVDS